MKPFCMILAITVLVACDDGSISPDDEGAASGKADDPAVVCAEGTESPLDGRSIEDMERTSKDPLVLATEDDVAALEAEPESSLLLKRLDVVALHFGREDARDLVTTTDSGVSAGQMLYGDVEYDLVIFFEDKESHGLVFVDAALDPIGEIGINDDIVGCKRR